MTTAWCQTVAVIYTMVIYQTPHHQPGTRLSGHSRLFSFWLNISQSQRSTQGHALDGPPLRHRQTPVNTHTNVSDQSRVDRDTNEQFGRKQEQWFYKVGATRGRSKNWKNKKCIYFYFFVQNCTTLNCHNGWIFRYLIVACMTPSLSGFVRRLLSSYSASKACV